MSIDIDVVSDFHGNRCSFLGNYLLIFMEIDIVSSKPRDSDSIHLLLLLSFSIRIFEKVSVFLKCNESSEDRHFPPLLLYGEDIDTYIAEVCNIPSLERKG